MIELCPTTIPIKSIPSLSHESEKTWVKFFREAEKSIAKEKVYEVQVQYKISFVYELIDKIGTYKKSRTLLEEKVRTPIKAKVLSLLAAGLIIAVIVGGSIGARYAAMTLTTAGGRNAAVAFGIVVATVVVANVMGAYFNYRWRGYQLKGGDYGSELVMALFGIVVPIWRIFGFGNLKKCVSDDFYSVREHLDEKSYVAIKKFLNSKPESDSRTKIEKELASLYAFFSISEVHQEETELKDSPMKQ